MNQSIFLMCLYLSSGYPKKFALTTTYNAKRIEGFSLCQNAKPGFFMYQSFLYCIFYVLCIFQKVHFHKIAEGQSQNINRFTTPDIYPSCLNV